MKTNKSDPKCRALRTQYRINTHQEAGLFDSMTGATMWALRNVSDFNWQIEPVATPL
jgi:hypothetical protein